MLRSIADTLLYWDHIAWYYVNIQWRAPLLDLIMPFMRNQWTWVPVYFFLLLFMPSRFSKKGWMWCLLFFISFVISDQISASLLKPFFERLRPCNNPALANIRHIIVPCGSGYSFPSSHAANHFSISVFSAVTLGYRYKWIWPVGILWAATVCYSQVYVGVHFPADVICGAIIGILAGTLTGRIFNRYFHIFPKETPVEIDSK